MAKRTFTKYPSSYVKASSNILNTNIDITDYDYDELLRIISIARKNKIPKRDVENYLDELADLGKLGDWLYDYMFEQLDEIYSIF